MLAQRMSHAWLLTARLEATLSQLDVAGAQGEMKEVRKIVLRAPRNAEAPIREI